MGVASHKCYNLDFSQQHTKFRHTTIWNYRFYNWLQFAIV